MTGWHKKGTHMKTIYKKELRQYFHSVIGYVFLAIFLLIGGYYFMVSNLLAGSGDIADFFQNIVQILIFLMPLLTMRSFSEEKRQKTEILLYTKARRIRDVVLGKYLAAMTVFGAGLFVTLAFPLILAACGSSQAALTAGCYMGLILLMGAFISIGMFVSSLTDNQIVAAAGTYLILFLMWYSYGFGSTVQNQALLRLLNRISLMNLYYELVMGVLNPSGILTLVSVSVIFLFLTCVFQERMWKIRPVTAVLFIAVVISLNGFIAALCGRFSLTGDLTKAQLFRLSAATKDLLQGLEETVSITCFDEKKGSDTNLSELLKRYGAYDRVDVRYVDLQANPGMASEYARRGLTLSDNGLLIEAGESARVIGWSELYGYNSYTGGDGKIHYNMTSFKAEVKISSAIWQVSAEKERTVFLTEGHGENAPARLKELIRDGGYAVDTGVLGVDGTLSRAEAVVIAGADRDFSGQEIETLDAFMKGGGSLLVFRSPAAGTLKNLDGYLAEWGLVPDETIVLEPSRQAGSEASIIPDFMVHMMNVYFSEHSSYLVLPVCGSLQASPKGGRLTAPVLKSTSESYAKPFSQATTLGREDGDAAGPFTLAATSEQTLDGEDGKTKVCRVFLVNCSGFYEESLLGNESLGNKDLILQALSYVSDSAQVLDIPEKRLSNTRIAPAWPRILAAGIVFIGILPSLLILTGLAVFIRRRRA